ncbi:hypothetical protein Tco_0972514 [Tanacetum coccineum]
MVIVHQSMEMDMGDQKKLAERRKSMKVRSGDYLNQNNSIAKIQFVEDSTKLMTARKSSEDGAIEDYLRQTLIDDLDEPLIVLESDERINKNEFSVAHVDVAPVGIVSFHWKEKSSRTSTAQRRTWDPRMTQYDVLKQYLKIKCFWRDFHRQHSATASFSGLREISLGIVLIEKPANLHKAIEWPN